MRPILSLSAAEERCALAVRSEINIREAISALGYVLQDDSPITVYVTSFLSTDQDTKVTHAFTLQ